jgi:hypothetical protein
MIAAKDPLGGGLDCTGAAGGVGLAGTFWGGAAFVAADVVGLMIGFDVVGFGGAGLELTADTGFGTARGAGGVIPCFTGTGGFWTAGLLVILVSGLGGRGSGSSAFRFVPALPLVGGSCRASSCFGSTFLGAATGAGEEIACDSGD